jgi:hypothetical protein
MTTETETLDARLAAIRDRTSQILAVASPSPDLMRANEAVHHAVAVLLARHAPEGVYARADECGHPEPPDLAGAGGEPWRIWDQGHPDGDGDIGRICKLAETGRCCPACTDLVYDEAAVSDDYVSAGNCIVRPLIDKVIMGEREPSAI